MFLKDIEFIPDFQISSTIRVTIWLVSSLFSAFLRNLEPRVI